MRNYVYILECRDGSWYTGWTNDLHRRIKAHTEGTGAKYTRARKAERFVYAEAFASKQEAMRREYEIKHLTRAQKEALVREGKPFRPGHIFCLMGKSATGKDHIYNSLLCDQQLGLKPFVIYTTRPMRSGETEGVEYHFTDEDGLALLEKEGKVVEKRSYRTIQGIWHYFTVDDEAVDLTGNTYLVMGTLASFRKLRTYYGKETVIPLYVQTDDVIRLERAMKREKKQARPDYEEMCRRFLADSRDFAKEKLSRAGILETFENNGRLEECISLIRDRIKEEQVESV